MLEDKRVERAERVDASGVQRECDFLVWLLELIEGWRAKRGHGQTVGTVEIDTGLTAISITTTALFVYFTFRYPPISVNDDTTLDFKNTNLKH